MSQNYLLKKMFDFDFLGFINFNKDIIEADINGFSLWEKGEQFKQEIEVIVKNLTKRKE